MYSDEDREDAVAYHMAKYQDKYRTCPYNPAHQIKPERMQYHLVKCAKVIGGNWFFS